MYCLAACTVKTGFPLYTEVYNLHKNTPDLYFEGQGQSAAVTEGIHTID